MKTLQKSFRDIAQYPSAVFGLIVIFLLFVLAAYALVTIPYQEAIRLWRGGEEVWYQNPKNAPPAWFNFFTRKKLTESFAVKGGEEGFTKEVTPGEQNTTTINFSILSNSITMITRRK